MPSFRSSAIGTSGASPRTVTAPAGIVAGDLLLLQVSSSGADVTPSAVPSGFTEIVAARITTLNTVRIYRKTATGSEPASYEVTFPSGSGHTIAMMAIQVVTPGNEISTDDVQISVNPSGNRIYPSVTATVLNTLMCMFGALGGNTGSIPPAGSDERWDGGSSPRIHSMTDDIAAIGSTGTRTATGTAVTNNCVSVLLKEEEPGGGITPFTPSKKTRFFLLSPDIVFAARVNQASFVYPLTQITYDTVTTGVYTDIRVNMTVLIGTTPGAHDLGMQRIRALPTSTILYLGRSSQGNNIGEIDPENDAYITVLDDYRIWSRPPSIDLTDEDVTHIQKDPGLAVEWRTTTPPPVANIGPGTAGTIDSITGLLTVSFGGTASFAVYAGATITTYAWDVGDGTITVGTSASSGITVTFPAGFRWVHLVVTDSEGHSATAHCPVFARDPAADACISAFQISTIRRGISGKRIGVRVRESIPATTYLPGTLALLWESEPTSPSDRSHMLLIGWMAQVDHETEAMQTATLSDTDIELVDVGGRLQELPAFEQRVENDALRDPEEYSAITWMHFVDLNLDYMIHYILAWHSTALSLADFTLSGVGSLYVATGLHSGGANLWTQAARKAASFVPDYVLTCNRLGQIRVLPDPMLRDVASRTSTVQTTVEASDWSDIRFTTGRHPRVHWLRSNAIRAGEDVVAGVASALASGEKPNIPTLFCIAPGEAPGQGESEQDHSEQLALSQSDLNKCEGHRYARINARQSEFRIRLAEGQDDLIEPADMTWVQVTIPASLAAQRGLSFTESRGLPKEVSIRYEYSPTGTVKTVEMLWERETVGKPATSIIYPENPDLPDDDTTWPGDFHGEPPPEIPDVPDDPFYDPVKAYVLWDGARIYYTANIAASPPIWEFADDGITGNIYDIQYVITGATTVGLWLMASTGIWFCNDIFTSPRTWTNVLPIATIRAADAVPTDGLVYPLSMANYGTEPGYLCVATGPQSSVSGNPTYEHAYFWHTHNYGANWTQVDMNYYTQTYLGSTRGFCYSDLFAMEIFRSSPGTIYCARSIPVIGLNRNMKVFISTDLGTTWTMAGYSPAVPLNNQQDMSILHPYPSPTSKSWWRFGTATGQNLHRSTNEWSGGSQMTDGSTPAGYAGTTSLWRPNKISLEEDHLLCWFHKDSNTEMVLLETNDGGISWNALYDPATTYVTVPNTPRGSVGGCAAHNTPNGWPPDSNIWFLPRAVSSPSGTVAGCILMTTDRFATAPTDKSGNIATLLGSATGWTHGPAGGIALPKIGPNV